LDVNVEKGGMLGNGGKLYYNANGNVLHMNTDPMEYFYLQDFTNETPLPHLNQSVRTRGSNGLVITALPEQEVLRETAYPHQAIKIFANGENEFGVVYTDAGTVNIDFFDHRDLHLITTLKTQLPVLSVSEYFFHLAGNELFVYHYRYTNGPLHHITIDF
jgi:hypothetical protein